ncbi:GGDEF domain-containing protein [Pseudoalteromonas mariniglutinosa]|uniref:GGDEF domain-containing protein n=1 Tax=Pseudoalteromonas mariniglutinosa TaxID=206042 RepID=UPI00385016A8
MKNEFSLNEFPCGLVVTTTTDHQIITANRYFYNICQQQPNSELSINSVFTPASKIMLESFLVPLLIAKKSCEEVQLTIINGAQERLPVLVNAQILPQQPSLIYWAITVAKQRDSLYQELVDLRNDLEEKAEKLETLSQTDELTGLLNRRAFLSQADTLIKRAIKKQTGCSFMMIDIDNFKDINDQHGHDMGDRVLRKVASIFTKHCPQDAILARIGGEEFALVMRHQTSDSAFTLAKKLVIEVNHEKIHDLVVTVSIGLASAYNIALEQLFKCADVLLYQAKNNGKNQLASQSIDQPINKDLE